MTNRRCGPAPDEESGRLGRTRPQARQWQQDTGRAEPPGRTYSAGQVTGPAPMSPGALVQLQRLSGNAAVAGLLASDRRISPAPPGAPIVQRRQGKSGTRGIIVHPKSTLSAAAIVRMLKKNKNVPDFLKKSLGTKGGAIVLRGRLPRKPEGTFSDFLEPYLAAITSPDWQITTATSTIDITGKPDDPTYFQIVRPDLAAGQRLGADVRSGPNETTFLATTLHSSKREVIFGWTVGDHATEKLGTGRGLIVVVTKITVTGQDGRQKIFIPTEDVILESILHEISAHAGRITRGEPDTHGNQPVEEIAEEVGEFFRYSTDARGAVPSATSTEIFAFIDATTRPAPK